MIVTRGAHHQNHRSDGHDDDQDHSRRDDRECLAAAPTARRPAGSARRSGVPCLWLLRHGVTRIRRTRWHGTRVPMWLGRILRLLVPRLLIARLLVAGRHEAGVLMIRALIRVRWIALCRMAH